MTARRAFRILWVLAVGGLLFAVPWDPNAVDSTRSFEAPSFRHPAGTDRLGRDVLSRTSLALRHTVSNVAVAESIGSCAALLLAMVIFSAFPRVGNIGATDLVTLSLRMVPPLLVALTVAVLLRGVPGALIASLAILSFAYSAPVFEGEICGVRQLPQLEAATILGAPRSWRLRHYIIPVIGPRITRYVLLDAMALAAFEALFGFFGLTDPTVPSLGGMIAEARFYLVESPWLFAAPAAALIVLLSGAWQGSVIANWR